MTRSDKTPSAYDEDFFAWTQHQAAALRRVGLRASPDVDIERVAEEIEDLGKRDLREVRSLLRLLLVHLLKIETVPDAQSVPHWRSEARAFGQSAADAFTPGMRRLLDVPTLWEEALRAAAADARDLHRAPPRARPCPFGPDDLLTGTIDVDAALARMAEG